MECKLNKMYIGWINNNDKIRKSRKHITIQGAHRGKPVYRRL